MSVTTRRPSGSNSDSSSVAAANIIHCGTGSITETGVSLPVAGIDEFERYEEMLVRLPQTLVIAEYFNYERFGEIVLALPLEGESRPYTGTAIDQPGAPALARSLANSLRRITLDDVNSAQNHQWEIAIRAGRFMRIGAEVGHDSFLLPLYCTVIVNRVVAQ